MPTLHQLIDAKNKSLDAVPNRFKSQMVQVQKDAYKQILILLGRLDQDSDGKFILNKKNQDILIEMDILLRSVIEKTEYGEAVTELAKEFNTQKVLNDNYFEKAFKGYKPTDQANFIVNQAQANAVDLLINTSLDADFINPVKTAIEQAVINRAGFQETMESLQLLIEGGEDKTGKIERYANQIAHDSFAVADRSYTSEISEQYDAEWFYYSGAIIETSREFCVERHDRYFYYKEVEDWASLDWAGKMEGTNSATIFSTAGGYFCGHSIMPVSIFMVPKDVILRNINNGNFTPSKFEASELGL